MHFGSWWFVAVHALWWIPLLALLVWAYLYARSKLATMADKRGPRDAAERSQRRGPEEPVPPGGERTARPGSGLARDFGPQGGAP